MESRLKTWINRVEIFSQKIVLFNKLTMDFMVLVVSKLEDVAGLERVEGWGDYIAANTDKAGTKGPGCARRLRRCGAPLSNVSCRGVGIGG